MKPAPQLVGKRKEIRVMGKSYAGAEGTTHARAKALAKKYREQGYRAMIRKSGSKWYVYRSQYKVK